MKKILWTIQDEAAFEVFEKTGVLRADPNHLLFDGDFQDAYQWMADQMRHRIGASPEGVQYPVWAWYQWEGQRKRMDLRRSGYAKRGTPLVQIIFEADPQEFLLSDFDAWHFVQNEHYLADSESKWDDFYANDGDQRKEEIIASWDKIFDMDHDVLNWDSKPTYRSIQATLWEIRMSQVIKVEHFLAK